MSPTKYGHFLCISTDTPPVTLDFTGNDYIHLVLHIFSVEKIPLIHRFSVDNYRFIPRVCTDYPHFIYS